MHISSNWWFYTTGLECQWSEPVAEPERYPKDIDLEKYDVIRYPVYKLNKGEWLSLNDIMIENLVKF